MSFSEFGLPLELEGVSVTFPQHQGLPLEVLKDLNLTVGGAEFLCVVGPSGCGKTTLLRVAHGLLRPDSGNVRLGGINITAPSPHAGFVFQDDLLLPWRTVLANALLPIEFRRRVTEADRTAAIDLLETVGLGRFVHSYPHHLSGGMRQRVNLARSLVTNPALLLLDEPFASLDAQTREILQEELLRIWSKFRKTVVFITHQIEEAVYLADRVVVMGSHPGRIKQVIPIDFPRPRPLEIKRSTEMGAYVQQAWDLIADEVRMTAGER